MRRVRQGAAIGLACAMLAGCAGHPATAPPSAAERARLLGLLQTGRPVLDCRQACLAEWRRAAPAAVQLDAAGRWSDLAVLVMQTRYQDDLTLYYLGRAAQGMGDTKAAGSYYRQSLQLSGTTIACANLSRLCGGLALPAATLGHLAEVDRALQPPKRRAVRIRPAPAPAAAPADSEAAEGYIEPPPAGH